MNKYLQLYFILNYTLFIFICIVFAKVYILQGFLDGFPVLVVSGCEDSEDVCAFICFTLIILVEYYCA